MAVNVSENLNVQKITEIDPLMPRQDMGIKLIGEGVFYRQPVSYSIVNACHGGETIIMAVRAQNLSQ